MISKRERIAYHEASHIMVAASLGSYKLAGAAVFYPHIQNDMWGRADYTPLGSLLFQMMATLAGSIGESFAMGTGGDYLTEGCETDVERIDDLLAEHFGKRVDRNRCDEFNEAVELAKFELRNIWPAVIKTAELLLIHGRLSGDECREIFEHFESGANMKTFSLRKHAAVEAATGLLDRASVAGRKQVTESEFQRFQSLVSVIDEENDLENRRLAVRSGSETLRKCGQPLRSFGFGAIAAELSNAISGRINEVNPGTVSRLESSALTALASCGYRV